MPPPKNLLLIPERFAIAMQDAGWYVRSRIAWCKRAAMPESVKDRPTSAWEHIWLFSKSRTYYYDADAVRQPNTEGTIERHSGPQEAPNQCAYSLGIHGHPRRHEGMLNVNGGYTNGANLRNFWLLGPEPSSLAHYASYPTEVVRRCIAAGTSERGACPSCGAPWRRVVERVKGREIEAPKLGQLAATGVSTNGTRDSTLGIGGHGNGGAWEEHGTKSITTGWQPSCTCDAGEPVPCVVLDCFGGSGTTGLVADRLGRDAILIELSPTYAEMARRRIASDLPLFADVVVEKSAELAERATPAPDLFSALEAAG